MGSRGTLPGLIAALAMSTPLSYGAWTGAEWITAVPAWLVGFSIVTWFTIVEVLLLMAAAATLDLAGRALRCITPALRLARRASAGLCRRCGYPLLGLPGPRCPECGEYATPTPPPRRR